MKAAFVSHEKVTDSIVSFTFAPAQPFTFTAGQYINLTLTGHQEHGAPAERWFTISSSPHEENITITTRVHESGNSAYKRALMSLLPGDEVDISDPLGAFVLPRFAQTPLVCIAGGIGITPFHSIANWLIDADETRPIKLMHSVRTEDDIVFQDVFEKANIHTTHVVTNPSAAWGGERGSLTGEMIIGIADPTEDTLFYISGPEPFVQHIKRQLEDCGISNQRLVVDEFQGYTQL